MRAIVCPAGASTADGKSGGKGDNKSAAASGGKSGGKAAKGTDDLSDRPFTKETYALCAGAFDLASLGWTQQDNKIITGNTDVAAGEHKNDQLMDKAMITAAV